MKYGMLIVMKLFNITAIFALCLLVVSGCARKQPRTFQETRTLMATYITITVDAENEDQAKRAIDAGFAEIKRLAGIFSIWSEGTELSRINAQAADHAVKASPEVMELVKRALEVARMTDGAFDPTVGPLVRLWSVTKRKVPPTPEEISKARELVDYRNIVIEDDTIRFLKNGVVFDPGGIAKGYTSDRVVAVLKGLGIRSGIVASAGDIKTFGGGLRKSPWLVGIQHPREKGVAATAAMADMAISTSGDYERYFEYEGRRYHHIIDPKTGYPAEGVRGLSVLHRDGVMCDGLSTGLFALGPQRARKKMEELGLAGVIIDANGAMLVSPAARGIVKAEGGK